ncbi:hypothetical protein HDU87_005777 [Geranomyces variabilis]|uniref:Uncharacterized protein n=1 Tax=Geranomyces variabilis TaxID=109894 RepID=A0AAD5THW4_9FUNG|nr:hypothetical protein HDU87_005777 [Geranomyces variabilis]
MAGPDGQIEEAEDAEVPSEDEDDNIEEVDEIDVREDAEKGNDEGDALTETQNGATRPSVEQKRKESEQDSTFDGGAAQKV